MYISDFSYFKNWWNGAVWNLFMERPSYYMTICTTRVPLTSTRCRPIFEILSLKYIRVANLTLRSRNLNGHVTTRFALFNFLYRCFIGTVTNFESAALTILELLALNAPKSTGVTWLTMRPFRLFRGHVGMVPEGMRAKFEVCIFSVFGANSI